MGKGGLFRRASVQVESGAYTTPHSQYGQQVEIATVPSHTIRGDLQQGIVRGVVRNPQTAQEKLQYGTTTSEGVTLTMGANGEVLASIENTSNSMAFGYVRKNGDYSRASGRHTIYGASSTGSTRLLSVTQSNTFEARVTHHDGNHTTVALRVDPSIETLHLKLGSKEYLIRASDITRAQAAAQASSAVPASAPTPSPQMNDVQDSLASQITPDSSPSDRAPQEDTTPDSVTRAAQPSRPSPKGEPAAKSGERAPVKRNAKATEAGPKPAETVKPSPEGSKKVAAEPVKEVKASETAPANRNAKAIEAGPKPAEPVKSSLEGTKKMATEPVKEVKASEAAPANKNTKTTGEVPKLSETAKSFTERTQKAIVETAKQIKDNAVKIYEKSMDTAKQKAQANDAASSSKDAARAPAKGGTPSPSSVEPQLPLKPEVSSGAVQSQIQQTVTPAKEAVKNSPEASTTVDTTPKRSAGASSSSGAVAEAGPSPLESTTGKAATPVETKIKNVTELKQVAELFSTSVKKSTWARNNPLKATVAMLAVSEAVTGAMEAGYDDEETHSAVPKLIQMLTKDIEGLESLQGGFTTAQGGLIASIAAESVSSAGDAGLAVTGIASAEKAIGILSRLSRVGKVPGISLLGKTFGRLGGGAFAAWDGYASFKDGQFMEMNDRQIAGAAGGSVVFGVAAFAFSGPPGWVVGGLSATGGVLYGVSVGLAEENKKLSISSPRKKAVVASIQRALTGFVHAEDSDMVKQRPHPSVFTQEEREQIEELARVDALANFVTTATPTQLQELGFAKVSEGDSAQQLSNASRSNYQRMSELLGEKSWFSWEHPLEAAKREHPAATQAFLKSVSDARIFYEDLYQRSIRVSYEYEGELNTFGVLGQVVAGQLGMELGKSSNEGKIAATSELRSVSKKIVASLPAADRDNPAKVLDVVMQHLPGLELIMRSDFGRNELINSLEDESGQSGVFRRALSVETAAQELQKAATGVDPSSTAPTTAPVSPEPPAPKQQPDQNQAPESEREPVKVRKERLDPSRTADASALHGTTAA
jgi:hypothetical protein